MAIDTGLVATYNLNGSYNNERGTGYNGVVTGSVPFVTGVKGQGVSFNGAGNTNNLKIGNPTLANVGTISLWFNPTSNVFSVPFGDASLWIGIVWNYNGVAGRIAAYIYSSAGIAVFADGISLNAWTHLAMTWNGTTLTFYVNGHLVGSTACGNIGNNTFDKYIGAPPTRNYYGSIDQVNVFQTVKNHKEIKQIMRTEHPFVTSGVGNFFNVM